MIKTGTEECRKKGGMRTSKKGVRIKEEEEELTTGREGLWNRNARRDIKQGKE